MGHDLGCFALWLCTEILGSPLFIILGNDGSMNYFPTKLGNDFKGITCKMFPSSSITSSVLTKKGN